MVTCDIWPKKIDWKHFTGTDFGPYRVRYVSACKNWRITKGEEFVFSYENKKEAFKQAKRLLEQCSPLIRQKGSQPRLV